ncbi:M36 family metallopeptidase [Conexibacter stalactiti]|uniref:M36 family metallopeptidase n=1 Tax=Conexibacter stalactiti TaxID=1940611 RepID=A0ABU4HQL1_9ACTN|nr:M36 family metallopeptidase [Conexibacter stalactiti]MDW5595588.1 M36 family metallopeptidase [Conexibacter stalactiti]MEC5036230.1 M36 family metallopeptidase [Conexibacter stalactiti]
MRARIAISLGGLLAVVAAAPAAAVQHQHDHGEQLPNVDRRAAERAPVPHQTRVARDRLDTALGALGSVETDAKSGGVAYVGRPDGLLTAPSTADPEQIVLDWVRDRRAVFGLDADDLAQLQLVARSVSPDGITHLRFNQVLDGVLAFDSGIDGHVTADGRLINVSGAPVPGAELPAGDPVPALDATDGLREARAAVDGRAPLPPTTSVKPGPSRTTSFAGGERAVLRWSATADGPRLAWSVIADDGDGHLYDVLVGADDGELLRRQSLTHELGAARYFAVDPDATPTQTQITMPPAWYDQHSGGTRLWGQYARTYVDPRDEDPIAGAEEGGARVQIAANGGTPAAPDWLYTPITSFPGAAPCPAASGCTWNRADILTAAANQLQVGANVHVLTSRFHDHLAQAPIGFDEASGNFQRENGTRAGWGGDYVRAEVNDGEGFNNANFSTPPDGEAPRMQMYLFQPRNVNGGDVADIVYHEYGHGLSNRLVVNASGASTLSSLQGRMMGEAWSDFYALDLLVAEGAVIDTPAPGELTVGEYAVGPGGVRAKPADCPVDPAGTTPACNGYFVVGSPVAGGYTYGDLALTENRTPHNGGEVWAELLWEIRTALGRDAALALVTGGMRLSVDNPSMLDMRDAILQQAGAMRSAPGAADDHYARLWRLFAARGMGSDARTPSSASSTPTEGYATAPSGLRLGGDAVVTDPYPLGDNDGMIEPGELFELHQPVMAMSFADLAGVTGTLASGNPALTTVAPTAAWPQLGAGRTAVNATPFSGRLAAGACKAAVPLTIAISSSAGSATAQLTLDPRSTSSAVVPIPDGAAGRPGVATATFEVPAGGVADDVDLRIGWLRHSYVGDLTIELIHDGVTAVVIDSLPNAAGDGPGSFSGIDIRDAIFDSDAAAVLPTANGATISGRVRPQTANALDAFNGHPVAGTWTLRISDHARLDAGTLRSWGVDSPQASCGRLEIPAAQTSVAAAVAHDAATVTGSVTPNGRATGMRFAWGTTTAYGATTPVVDAGAGDAAVAAGAALAGLAPSTTYHYRVETVREGGQVAVAGEDRSFTTAPQPPGGSGPPAPGPGPQVLPPSPLPPRDTAAPRFTPRPRVTVAKAKRGARRRAVTIALALSEPARVTATVTRSAPGIRSGRRCVAVPRRRPRGATSCTRQVAAATARATLARAGAATLKLPGGGLAKGSYSATLTAVDAAGNRATAVVRFSVK